MQLSIRHSISNKVMLVVMATTSIALLAYGVLMLVYDIRSYHDTVVKDLATQANIIAEVSAPALEFNDPVTGKENLELLRTRPVILRAALFTPEGRRFAEYASQKEQNVVWPEVPAYIEDFTITGNRIAVWRAIVKDGRLLGTVYIYASYDVQKRLVDYAIILACVMAAALGLATLVAIWLKGAITKPIFAVTDVARQVMKSRDFSLRAQQFSEDEIGVLVQAFNNMLGEVERRASALEASNQSLEHEMSERQMAENALRLADRRKDEFLATLAHELRNPLAPLRNGLQILRMQNSDADALIRAQTIMERQLKQMVRLVDDLLDVSRITTGKLSIVKSQVDVRSVMRDAIETSSTFIEECGHQLQVHMPDEAVWIEADPIRLAQVFSNLLNNAAKYTDRGGLITFAAAVKDGRLSVSVTDNGIGIAEDMLNEIFAMFTQVDHSIERAHAGLGVGLALSKHLIDLHGGTLIASSGGAGRGSIFCVGLATVERQPSADPLAHAKDVEKARRRIMLVDDNVDYISTMATLLTMLGHDVRTAHDGNAAVQVAQEFAPEFVFMDIGMPGMSGYDVARRLRQQPQLASSVLIAVTGWGQEKDRQLSRSAGFDVHLVKPVELAQILAVLEGKVKV